MNSRICQHPVLKDTVIIATSASVYEEEHQKSRESGADAFLPKPIVLTVAGFILTFAAFPLRRIFFALSSS